MEWFSLHPVLNIEYGVKIPLNHRVHLLGMVMQSVERQRMILAASSFRGIPNG